MQHVVPIHRSRRISVGLDTPNFLIRRSPNRVHGRPQEPIGPGVKFFPPTGIHGSPHDSTENGSPFGSQQMWVRCRWDRKVNSWPSALSMSALLSSSSIDKGLLAAEREASVLLHPVLADGVGGRPVRGPWQAASHGEYARRDEEVFVLHIHGIGTLFGSLAED